MAGEIGTEIGIAAVTAPHLLKTTAGKLMAGVSGTYNIGAGAAGVDPTEKDANGNLREMSPLERGLRIGSGALEIFGARPTLSEAGTTASKGAQQAEEVVEAVTPEGQVVKVQAPKTETIGGKSTNVQEMRLPDMDEQIEGNPVRERWREYLGEGEEADMVNVANKRGAGMAEQPQHHVFPQEFRKFFEERGFTGERSIDKFVVTMQQSDHEAIHGVNSKTARRVWADGEWNSKVIRQLRRDEKDLGRKLMFEEIKAKVEVFMEQYGIPKNYQTYRGGVK